MNRHRPFIWIVALFLSVTALPVVMADSAYYAEEDRVPRYILNGLRVYAEKGYEPAVYAWFQDSPWANAAVLVGRIAYLKNIEMLYGHYQGYEIVMTNETRTSQMTYIRFIFSRMAGYAMFLSQMHNNNWVLSQLELHEQQKYAEAKQPDKNGAVTQ